MIAWQAINSAPLDGTFVLLRGGYINPDSTDGDTKHPPCVVAYWYDYRGSNDGVWIITDFDGGAASVSYEKPTEWASLEEVR